jgi:hypothetical protein
MGVIFCTHRARFCLRAGSPVILALAVPTPDRSKIVTLDQAQTEAAKIFAGETLEFDRHLGKSRILRVLTDDEAWVAPAGKTASKAAEIVNIHTKATVAKFSPPLNVTNGGKIVYGSGNSWLDAMRNASERVLKEMRAQEALDRQEIQKERNQFEDFLREKLMPEFEAWKAAREAPVPEVSSANPG